ncbi:MAG: ribonuclease P protein component [Bacillota bacterium]|nr:ribonuclease P protein component [Bacillota bacterium]
MKHTISLKKNRDFARLYKKGDCLVCSCFVMYYLPNGLKQNRIGITVSKKIGKAVIRNRIKRLIRESYRSFEEYASGYDIVFVARSKMPEVGFFDLKQAMKKLFEKSNIKG